MVLFTERLRLPVRLHDSAAAIRATAVAAAALVAVGSGTVAGRGAIDAGIDGLVKPDVSTFESYEMRALPWS
jgi:hypothetical protein